MLENVLNFKSNPFAFKSNPFAFKINPFAFKSNPFASYRQLHFKQKIQPLSPTDKRIIKSIVVLKIMTYFDLMLVFRKVLKLHPRMTLVKFHNKCGLLTC